MNLCILSGKGGTGKTTVSVNLARLMGANYVDCDVEEPNGFLFLNPEGIISREVQVDYPMISKEKCTLCGDCVHACVYHALAGTKSEVMLFEQICHGCHACSLVCPADAITYGARPIGTVETGRSGNIGCARGVLNVGEHMGVPVIRELMKNLPEGNCLFDAAPGTACSVVNTLKHSDGAIIVTEPTTFGLHDMKLAVELLRQVEIPFGVVINKYIPEESRTEDYCSEAGIEVWGRLPYRRQAAEVYSGGGMLIDLPEYRNAFENIARSVREVFLWN